MQKGSSVNEAFFDTSVLIYAYDKSAPEKEVIAKELVENVFLGDTVGYISNQVLGELYFVLTEKKGVSKENAKTIFLSFAESENWKKLNYSVQTVKTAVNSSKELNVMFWDALIAETMKENEITAVYTEDEKDFKKVSGIKVINPFKK